MTATGKKDTSELKDWTIVLWSDALQIAQRAGLDAGIFPDKGVTPEAYFAELKQSGQHIDAILFIANALPRLEAIAWAESSIPELDQAAADFKKRRLIRDASRRWIDEPDDQNRRAVHELCETANQEWPETLLGLAIFFSGGSIAPSDLDQVQADPTVSASLIAGALQMAEIEYSNQIQIMDASLDLANEVAVSGRAALVRP